MALIMEQDYEMKTELMAIGYEHRQYYHQGP
jgi:hypothetical protein